MDSPGMCGEGPVLMESHQTPGVPTSLSPEPDSTSREDLSCSFISVLSDMEFFGFCPKFDQKLHMQGGSVDFRWGGRSAAGSGTAVCYWRKAAGLPSALTCASVLVHLEKTLSINHCPA